MRTLDTQFLKENPPGEEQSKIKLSLDIPLSVEVENNPDGTRPSVTLEASADRHSHALSALAELNNSEYLEQLAVGMVEMHFDIDAETAATGEFLELARKLEVPFPVHEFDLTLTLQDDSEAEVAIKVTAPSIQVAVVAMHKMTGRNSLVQVAIGLCPELDDDDDFGDPDEILMVSGR